MPILKFKEILSFSSEDPNHPVDNLLKPDTFRKWRCAAGLSEKQAYVILKMERLCSIHSVDIGNNGSAFIEVLVAREGGEFQVLLVASSFMTPLESRNGSELNRVRMFGLDKLNKNVAEQKWDRVKVICTQPFNKNVQFGLSFITVTAPSEGASSTPSKGIKLGSFTLKEEEELDPISIGSLFASKKDSGHSSPLTGAAAIRAASVSAANISSNPETKKAKTTNAPEVGFYQLKKNSTENGKHAEESKERNEVKKKKHAEEGNGNHREKLKDKNQENMKEESKRRKEDKAHKQKQSEDRRTPKQTEVRQTPKQTEAKHTPKQTQNKKTHTSASAKAHTSASPSTMAKRKSAPFSALLKNVTFVMSGYQNPQRSQIRDMMLEMGARYKSDWDKTCTHLICAFANTPKYQQVKGKGKIVNAKWIFQSHKDKIRYPCKRYALDKQQDSDDSEEELWAEELLPKETKSDPSTVQGAYNEEDMEDKEYSNDAYSDSEDTEDEIERVLNKKENERKNLSEKNKVTSLDEMDTKAGSSKRLDDSSEKPPYKKVKVERETQSLHNKPSMEDNEVSSTHRRSSKVDEEEPMNVSRNDAYDEDTDIDEENKEHMVLPDTSNIPLPDLTDCLKGKKFYIYGNLSENMRELLSRYVIAFAGILEEYMTDKVNFVLTEDAWDDNFDDALIDHPSLQFVRPAWIWRCSDKRKLVPFQPYMVVPKEM